MRKVFCCLAIAGAMSGTAVHAADVGFNVGINIGNQPRVAVPAPPVYATPAPVVYAPPVVIEEPPQFIEPPELGFYAAVGVPYDLFLVSNRYYLCKGNVWYAAPSYNGPWVSVRYQALPSPLRRRPVERMRYYRDAGYRNYHQGHNPYWENHHFQPKKEWKEARKREHEELKREKHFEKEARKREHEELKQEKQHEKEYQKHGGRHGDRD